MSQICSAPQASEPARHDQSLNVSPAAQTGSPLNANQGVGTLDQLATFLYKGAWEVDGLSQRSYDLSSSNQITVNISNLNADGQQLARWAFEAWELVANVDFVESNSEEVMIAFNDEDSGAYASSSTLGLNIIASEVNLDKNWITQYGNTISSSTFSTYVHEIGHALGLGHQGPYDGSATYGVDEIFSNDSYQASVMSYFSQTDNTTVNASYAEPITAMMADIVAIQSLYGAPDASSQTAGDTIWSANSNIVGYLADVFDGLGNSNANLGNDPVAFTIYDRDGTDRIDLSASNDNNRLDMRGEAFSDIAGLIGNVAIARDTVIENATLGSGNDTVIGNDVANMILTRDGSDVIYARDGDDIVYSGSGADIVYGSGGNDTLGSGDGDDQVFGGAGSDVLYGGADNDMLGGGDGQDRAYGGTGNDTVYGGNDDDNLGGSNGTDRVYSGAGNDMIFGAAGNDELGGASGDDTIFGGADNDTIFGGMGSDRLIGGTGNDELTGSTDADSFVFFSGSGEDTVTDFALGEDALLLGSALTGGLDTGADVTSSFGRVENGTAILEFSGGELITFTGVSDLNALASDIAFL